MPTLTKRQILAAGGVGGLAAVAGGTLWRADQTRPIAAAPSAPGHVLDPLNDDQDVELTQSSELRAGHNDLTRIAPGRAPASGVPILISGRLTNGFGRPLAATRIEIWNANRWGRYTHINDPSDLPDDPNFAGIGRTMTDSRGRYHFLTVMPGTYLAEQGSERHRPAHVHVAIRSGTARLATEMFFAGDSQLTQDPSALRLGPALERQIAQAFTPRVAQAERGFRFDIVADGRQSTLFE